MSNIIELFYMLRREKFAVGEYYHIYNRENAKQPIFFEERDWIRFLFLIIYLQSPVSLYNMGRPVANFVKYRKFNIPESIQEQIIKNRYVELINFCLMPNHFHITACEIQEGGISKYLQRVQIAYTKYLNTKNGKPGHLFQGAFRSVHVNNNDQLLHLSAYIHKNPREIREWKNKEEEYFWSSYQDYTKENRWGEFLKREIILGQFSSPKEYKIFIKTSSAKLSQDEIDMLTIEQITNNC